MSADRSLVALLALTVALAVGLAACDSGGSTSEENGDNGTGTDIAQTFTVSVKSIDDSYPYNDQNSVGVAYAIDGDVGKVLSLEMGETYEFVLEEEVQSGPNGAAHPFYVGNTAEGQGGDEFDDGVQNAKSTSGSVFFTPPSSAPDSLFYQCGQHVYMGGKMTISGSSDDASSGDDGNDGSGGDY